ncbi:HAD-IB family hydrolase [Acidithrix sp. C25]|uniref:Short chain dehydrogenase n=1 Tax=Acidithrix ferrooxidans TaxID=1280514 RepID=A0A0D8HGQ5_9ACTN|nr:HAD-IB family hydrolase [Acidithrix sp. C25]KJF17103.1 short chain dehydrogenase [Acidithrix ferrooxidans]
MTGATGFLGTALAERILNVIPDAKLILLIRAGRRASPIERAKREIIKNDAFNLMRERFGDDFDRYINSHLSAVPGDVSKPLLGLDDSGLDALASADIVVHSAATVSFDSPLTQAVSVNLLGPTNVGDAIKAAAQRAGKAPTDTHFITVSTAYVAGYRRGLAPEKLLRNTPFSPMPDFKTEVNVASQLRDEVERDSRVPERLEDFKKSARKELGAVGGPLLAQKLEKIRDEWVNDRLVELGIARAQSLGWPDAYTYTKALGEEALVSNHSDLAISVVRPSIIESSMIHPFPGWIKGFRMAEPIIISYARGLLKEFPGVPEGIIDVIPVDFVTGTILAVAAEDKPKPSTNIPVYQVASGSANPLRYKVLVDLVREWFLEHPLYDSQGQPILVPEWNFPGRGRVQKQLARLATNLEFADSIISHLPLRGERAELVTDLEEKKEAINRALSYVKLYGSYAETEAIFDVKNLLALWNKQSASDQLDFAFDPRLINWDSFVTEIHLPSVVKHARVKTTPDRKSTSARVDRTTSSILNDEFKVAAFDLENTVIASNVVDAYAWFATKDLPLGKKALFSLALMAEGPSLIASDRSDRGDFLRNFYRRYSKAEAAHLSEDANELFNSYLLKKAFPRAIERIRHHRRLGHKTILITGALDFVIAPLAPLFDDIVACTMTTDSRGRLTGNLDQTPPTGEARAILLGDFADKYEVSLSKCVAYADSSSDLPMLEAVGFPVAVNPEPRLLAMAKRRGWTIENWERQPGHSKLLLPIGKAR